MVKFHETGMGLVLVDQRRLAAGFTPLAALNRLFGRQRVLVIVTTLLGVDLFRTQTDHFARQRILDLFAAARAS